MRAASAALGQQLRAPSPLPGSDRATVLRCWTASSSVIVKAYAAHARDSYDRELAGLTVCGRGPSVLAVHPATPLIVMSDLGAGPSLADVLLTGSEEAAVTALTGWAGEYAAVVAQTPADTDRWLDVAGPSLPPATVQSTLSACYAELPTMLRENDLTTPALDHELAEVARLTAQFPVFTPGDVCPDNNVITAESIRLLDFEGSGVAGAFLTAAYVSMPFATCWCVYRLSDNVRAQLERIFRAAVAERYPPLADDASWRRGLDAATAAWTLHATVALVPRALRSDLPMHPTRRPVPSARQLLRYRWEGIADQASFPVLAQLGRQLLATTVQWSAPPLPEYPAFTAAQVR